MINTYKITGSCISTTGKKTKNKILDLIKPVRTQDLERCQLCNKGEGISKIGLAAMIAGVGTTAHALVPTTFQNH